MGIAIDDGLISAIPPHLSERFLGKREDGETQREGE